MKLKLTLAVLAILIVSSGLVLSVEAYQAYTQPNAQTALKQPIQQPQPPTPEELLSLVNAERAKVNVAPLRLDPLLNQSAQIKAEDMDKNNYFGHVDANGKRGYTYVTDVGKRCIWQSENYYASNHRKASEDALRWWMNSESHRLAMLDIKYESTGLGIVPTVEGDMIIVQHFCDEQ